MYERAIIRANTRKNTCPISDNLGATRQTGISLYEIKADNATDVEWGPDIWTNRTNNRVIHAVYFWVQLVRLFVYSTQT
jgi:hypothetical protein